ncbi:MAG: hypothetical protein VKJ46_15950 [Leptolyngbyaceae bacterium]|nr:hypothetical protein [Leptolyngbyaceae bacterium]
MNLDPELMQQFEAEMKQLETEEFPPSEVVMSPLVIFALITQIQLASRHPFNSNWYATQSQSLARELQTVFNPDSAIYQILEMGWNPEVGFEAWAEGRIRQHIRAIQQHLVEELNKQDPDSEWEIAGDGSVEAV